MLVTRSSVSGYVWAYWAAGTTGEHDDKAFKRDDGKNCAQQSSSFDSHDPDNLASGLSVQGFGFRGYGDRGLGWRVGSACV